jgi:hypothetical protein
MSEGTRTEIAINLVCFFPVLQSPFATLPSVRIDKRKKSITKGWTS